LIDHNLKKSGYDAKIIHIIHDEVIVEARADIADEVAMTVKKCMESAMEKRVPEVPFIVEPEIRKTWGEPSDEFSI
jgi:DNA polymerase I